MEGHKHILKYVDPTGKGVAHAAGTDSSGQYSFNKEAAAAAGGRIRSCSLLQPTAGTVAAAALTTGTAGVMATSLTEVHPDVAGSSLATSVSPARHDHHHDQPLETAREVIKRLLLDPTHDNALLVELLMKKMAEKNQVPAAVAAALPVGGRDFVRTSRRCKFCRNNNEEDIFHDFKDKAGRVVCPVLSQHVCELCGETGGSAHTRKYCPLNPLTHGQPEKAGFPPGMLPRDVIENTLDMLQSLKLSGNECNLPSQD